jgi:glycosyltransferase involved in cell wall biosynthesis
MSIVFLQRRTNRAGAQVALSRMLTAQSMMALDPIVIVQKNGWLTDELRSQGVKVAVLPYPSTRSLTGQLWRNRAFVRDVAAAIGKPVAVFANNHQEAWLAKEIGKAVGARSAVIIRDSYATKETLEKYDWDVPDHALAVGEKMWSFVSGLNDSVPVSPLYDSVLAEYFYAPKKVDRFPDRVLAMGSHHPMKGWRELIAAIKEARVIEPEMTRVQFDFTADGKSEDGIKFVGHLPDFPNKVRDYDLAINPSKSETFGLAALETLAAGVPLITTKVGVVGSIVPVPSNMIFGHATMADSLVKTFRDWPNIEPHIAASQNAIRQFTPGASAASVIDVVDRMQRGE